MPRSSSSASPSSPLSVLRPRHGPRCNRPRRDRGQRLSRQPSISRPRRTWSPRPVSGATTIACAPATCRCSRSTSTTAAEHADVTEKMIRKLRAGQMPPPGSRRPEERCSTRWPTCSKRKPTRRRRAVAGPAHVPAAESRRVHAIDPRSARARRQRRRLPAARHQERQLRQHRRRAAAVADVDAVVSDRGRRDSAVLPWAIAPRRRAKRRTRCRAGPRSGNRSRARRTGRAAASSVTHTFPADGEYRFRVSFYHETTGALYGNGRAALHTARRARAGRDLDRRRARGAARRRPLDEHLRSRRRQPAHGADRDHGRTASRVGGVHPPPRRAGPGSDLAARLVAREHQHRRRLRLHDAAAPARHGDHRSVRRDRRVGDAEPAAIFTCHPEHGTAADGVRARDRVAPRVTGVPPDADRARSQRVDVALQGTARRRAASRRACAWRSKAILASPRFVFRFEERPADAAGAIYALGETGPRVAAVVLPLGDAGRTPS